jgi:biopolymer transport protein ExbD
MQYKRSKSQDSAGIVEMTPMIDIVFLLIIFFMVASQFAQQSILDLNLPEEKGEQDTNPQTTGLVINIREDGAIILDTDTPPLTLVLLEERIEKAVAKGGIPWQSLLIRADQHASTTVLNDVLRILNKHGFSATRLATEVP